MKDAIIVGLILLALILGFGTSRQPEAAIQDTTLHRADYPLCVTIHNGPLEPKPHGTNLYPRRSDTA